MNHIHIQDNAPHEPFPLQTPPILFHVLLILLIVTAASLRSISLDNPPSRHPASGHALVIFILANGVNLIKILVLQAALSRNLASVCLSVPNAVTTIHRRTINYGVCTKDALPRLYCDLSAEAKIIVSLLSILVVPLTIRPESPYLAPALAGTVGHLVYRYRRALEEDPNEYQDPNEVIVPRPLLPALPIPLPLFQNCGNLAPAIESAAFPLNHSPIPSLSPKASPPTFSRTTVQAHALPKLLRWTYKEAGTFPLPPLKATPPIPLLPAASPARLIHGPPKVLRTEFEDAEALFGDKKGSNTREMW